MDPENKERNKRWNGTNDNAYVERSTQKKATNLNKGRTNHNRNKSYGDKRDGPASGSKNFSRSHNYDGRSDYYTGNYKRSEDIPPRFRKNHEKRNSNRTAPVDNKQSTKVADKKERNEPVAAPQALAAVAPPPEGNVWKERRDLMQELTPNTGEEEEEQLRQALELSKCDEEGFQQLPPDIGEDKRYDDNTLTNGMPPPVRDPQVSPNRPDVTPRSSMEMSLSHRNNPRMNLPLPVKKDDDTRQFTFPSPPGYKMPPGRNDVENGAASFYRNGPAMMPPHGDVQRSVSYGGARPKTTQGNYPARRMFSNPESEESLHSRGIDQSAFKENPDTKFFKHRTSEPISSEPGFMKGDSVFNALVSSPTSRQMLNSGPSISEQDQSVISVGSLSSQNGLSRTDESFWSPKRAKESQEREQNHDFFSNSIEPEQSNQLLFGQSIPPGSIKDRSLFNGNEPWENFPIKGSQDQTFNKKGTNLLFTSPVRTPAHSTSSQDEQLYPQGQVSALSGSHGNQAASQPAMDLHFLDSTDESGNGSPLVEHTKSFNDSPLSKPISAHQQELNFKALCVRRNIRVKSDENEVLREGSQNQRFCEGSTANSEERRVLDVSIKADVSSGCDILDYGGGELNGLSSDLSQQLSISQESATSDHADRGTSLQARDTPENVRMQNKSIPVEENTLRNDSENDDQSQASGSVNEGSVKGSSSDKENTDKKIRERQLSDCVEYQPQIPPNVFKAIPVMPMFPMMPSLMPPGMVPAMFPAMIPIGAMPPIPPAVQSNKAANSRGSSRSNSPSCTQTSQETEQKEQTPSEMVNQGNNIPFKPRMPLKPFQEYMTTPQNQASGPSSIICIPGSKPDIPPFLPNGEINTQNKIQVSTDPSSNDNQPVEEKPELVSQSHADLSISTMNSNAQNVLTSGTASQGQGQVSTPANGTQTLEIITGANGNSQVIPNNVAPMQQPHEMPPFLNADGSQKYEYMNGMNVPSSDYAQGMPNMNCMPPYGYDPREFSSNQSMPYQNQSMPSFMQHPANTGYMSHSSYMQQPWPSNMAENMYTNPGMQGHQMHNNPAWMNGQMYPQMSGSMQHPYMSPMHQSNQAHFRSQYMGEMPYNMPSHVPYQHQFYPNQRFPVTNMPNAPNGAFHGPTYMQQNRMPAAGSYMPHRPPMNMPNGPNTWHAGMPRMSPPRAPSGGLLATQVSPQQQAQPPAWVPPPEPQRVETKQSSPENQKVPAEVSPKQELGRNIEPVDDVKSGPQKAKSFQQEAEIKSNSTDPEVNKNLKNKTDESNVPNKKQEQAKPEMPTQEQIQYMQKMQYMWCHQQQQMYMTQMQWMQQMQKAQENDSNNNKSPGISNTAPEFDSSAYNAGSKNTENDVNKIDSRIVCTDNNDDQDINAAGNDVSKIKCPKDRKCANKRECKYFHPAWQKGRIPKSKSVCDENS